MKDILRPETIEMLIEALGEMIDSVESGSDPRDGQGQFGSGTSPLISAKKAYAEAKSQTSNPNAQTGKE